MVRPALGDRPLSTRLWPPLIHLGPDQCIRPASLTLRTLVCALPSSVSSCTLPRQNQASGEEQGATEGLKPGKRLTQGQLG